MRETQPERAPATADQTYRVSTGAAQGTVERRVEALTADTNRLLQDVAIRLTRIEARLDALEKK